MTSKDPLPDMQGMRSKPFLQCCIRAVLACCTPSCCCSSVVLVIHAGQADDTRGNSQPCSDFKLGYYFRGIARQEEKLQAKADAQQRKDQSRTGKGSAPAAPAADLQTNSPIHFTSLLEKARLNKLRKQRKQNRATCRQQRSQCCGVPVHLVVVVCMSVGATAVLGVFLALPLYLYLDRFPHMEC